MLNFIGTKIILKGLNVYRNHSMSFADAEGIACIDDKMGPALLGIVVLKRIFANSDLAPPREIFL